MFAFAIEMRGFTLSCKSLLHSLFCLFKIIRFQVKQSFSISKVSPSSNTISSQSYYIFKYLIYIIPRFS
ncbi:hypothetical protein FGO68_gene14967 [Halteria grandinella]|uniref:Uncharacterized protein n=1 Tax=Halteria grandinella TaxID=5974 RepID=A0A8J8NME1_HALGN|nr:hypothetical protein FGO68_gene14967 [Halteria grandinella]